jgi:hypothetical protein
MKQFNIAINGQRAVDAAYAFIRTRCYRGIYNHGEKIAQVEVVIDDPGTYNGNPNKWVDVTVLEQKQIETVVKQLSRLGFMGCPCIVQEESLIGCLATGTDLCCFII